MPDRAGGRGAAAKSTAQLLGTAQSLIGSELGSAYTGRTRGRNKAVTVPQPFMFEERAKSLPRGIAKLR